MLGKQAKGETMKKWWAFWRSEPRATLTQQQLEEEIQEEPAETSLSKAEAIKRALSSGEWVAHLSAQGELVAACPALLKGLGWSAQDVRGKPRRDWIGGGLRRDDDQRWLAEALAGKRRSPETIKGERSNGAAQWMRLSAWPFEDPGSGEIGLMVSVEPIRAPSNEARQKMADQRALMLERSEPAKDRTMTRWRFKAIEQKEIAKRRAAG